jgi:hypothetical protein
VLLHVSRSHNGFALLMHAVDLSLLCLDCCYGLLDLIHLQEELLHLFRALSLSCCESCFYVKHLGAPARALGALDSAQ